MHGTPLYFGPLLVATPGRGDDRNPLIDVRLAPRRESLPGEPLWTSRGSTPTPTSGGQACNLAILSRSGGGCWRGPVLGSVSRGDM
ncbi:hypothetical protein [Parafrankia soli]|uniref:hypothetical protein n=1 Tax=Parafrankia soli TaxID=2599596 RepID=UPI0018E2F3B9|nr:hypothetical protein [Parafrankia soli]